MIQGRWTRLVPNAPLHVAGLAIVRAAPLLLILGMIFGAWTLAAVGAAMMLFGRLPLILIQEPNRFSSRVTSDMRIDAGSITVEGKPFLSKSEINEAVVYPHGSKKPTVRVYGKNKLIPKLDLEVDDHEQAQTVLAELGFSAAEKPASFHTLTPKLMAFAPLAMCAPLLVFLPLLLHHTNWNGRLQAHGPMLQWMVICLGLAHAVIQIPRRVVVRPDGIESSFFGRFRRFYPFADVARVVRTLNAGWLELKNGKRFQFRAGVTAVALTDQRSNDVIVERAADAYDAWCAREAPEKLAKAGAKQGDEIEAPLPAEVIRVRPNWIGWLIPTIAFSAWIAAVASKSVHSLAPFHAAALLSLVALFYTMINPHRFKKQRLTASSDWITIGTTKIERSRLENAYVQPKNSSNSWMLRKQYSLFPRVMFVGKKWRDSTSIFVKDEAEGRAVLKALAFDPAHATSTFTVQAGLFANPALRFAIYMVPILGMQWIVRTHGPARVALILAMVFSWVNTFWPTKLKIGVDGVLIKSLRSSQFYGFSEIARVEQSSGGISLVMTSGKRVEVRTTIAVGGQGGGQPAAAIMKRIQDGMIFSRKNTSDVALALARGSLRARAWMDRLRAVGRGEAEAYRVPAIATEDLWRVVEDASKQPDERIAAAVALHVDDAAASRLRVAASVSASPKVRAALEAAADQNEELLEQALDESDAGESMRAQ